MGGEWSASRPGRTLAPGKGPRYPLYRSLGVPQSRSGHRGWRKNSFASAGDQTSIARSSSPLPDTIQTELLRLTSPLTAVIKWWNILHALRVSYKEEAEHCAAVVATRDSGHPSAHSLLLPHVPHSLVFISFPDKVIFSLSFKIKNDTEGLYNLGRTFIRDIARVVIQLVTTLKYTC
jgi:hypothetical protein